jgi:hypothetical protein
MAMVILEKDKRMILSAPQYQIEAYALKVLQQDKKIREEVAEGVSYFLTVAQPTYDIAAELIPEVERMFREWNTLLAILN